MKHLFIINPVAGGKDHSHELRLRAAELLYGRDCEVYVTKAPMDACRKVREAAADGRELRVYACGGDGTLNECVCGAAGLENVAVTHYPCGTGNDFIKLFGAEGERFYDLASLIDGETRELDLIEVNGRYSINICSVGVDARIGTDVHKYSRMPVIGGAAGYIVSLVVNLCKGVNQHLRVKAEGFDWEGGSALVCACNGRWYGGSFNPSTTARPDDGLVDFLVVRDVTRRAFLSLVGPYSKGRYADMPQYITHLSGTWMDISADEEIVVNVDGEAIYAKDISLRLHPRAIRLVCPRGMEFFAKTDERTSKTL